MEEHISWIELRDEQRGTVTDAEVARLAIAGPLVILDGANAAEFRRHFLAHLEKQGFPFPGGIVSREGSEGRRGQESAMRTTRDAETLGLLFQALAEQQCRTVSLLAQRLGVPYGPPLLTVIGVRDDPRSRWAEIEGLVGLLQLAERPAEPPRDPGMTWEEMTEREREVWLRNAQTGPS